MCFIIKNRISIPIPNIADKDITVYKVITKDNWGWFKNLQITNNRNNVHCEKWQRGFHYYETTPFKSAKVDFMWNAVRIKGDAFHSKKTRKLAENIRHSYGNEIVVKMVIPKGAKYYENDTEYVSSDIIFPLLNKKKTK